MFKLPEKLYQKKRKELFSKLQKENIDAICLFSPTYVSHLTGYTFLATERPIAYVFDQESQKIVIPRLEKEHIEEKGIEFDKKIVYPEYPGKKRPMKYLKEILEEEDYNKIGVDSDGYSSSYGYFGPQLSELISTEIQNIRLELEKFISIKHEKEIELLKESAKWENLGLQYLKEKTEPGKSEMEITMEASKKASKAIIKTYGNKFERTGSRGDPIKAFYRGQVGKRSALPHAMAANETIEKGDVLGASASSHVGRYLSELERTWIVGKPTKKQKKYFELMLKAQEIAFDTIEAGIKCSEVDKAVLDFFEREGIEEHWRHHVGHGLSTRGHTPPFLDIGEDWIIKENMVLSVEPGVYINGFGGFRHSDTVVVTKNGIESITYFPRDLENSIIEVE